ncbi:LacI family DNA-binding transcriptional regulator [Brachybacterium saurashtrense]|uniref:LacI family transcriptional regulator n=1 Tax=Brachybacterium saurashtrense TaxID=556288 RepID=A0A345YP85_9MICO|nr:substrate-binding domain-containing protein [Brachybacterium saurashtrense]AXK45737.1 LacI family transcriptional regulator [Brachybacterium saurashtrense]RRR24755.1 LacI family transcriptional regulator [Brachybacterium saurashtrense]
MGSRVTVRQIAAAAGVSAATVSRALSGRAKVAEPTRRRIEEAARRLGHLDDDAQPGPGPRGRAAAGGVIPGSGAPGSSVSGRAAAGSAVSGRAAAGRALALLAPDLEHPSYAGLLKGASREAMREGFTLAVADSDGDHALEARTAHALCDHVAGLFLASTRLRDDEIRQLAERVPVVLTNRTVEGVDSVRYDGAAPMRRALEHLHALGHRRIAYAGGPEHSLADRSRRDGIARVAPGLSGLEMRDLGHFEPGHGEGRSAADLLIASDATAVLAYNDMVAVQILSRVRERGLEVPEHLSVVGVDDSILATVSHPQLTTVRTPHLAIGRTAVTLLLDRIAPRSAPRPEIVLPVALVVRESTAAPRRGAAGAR